MLFVVQFVVNTYGSLAQAGFVFLLLPVLSSLKNIPLRQLPNYLQEGESEFSDLDASSSQIRSHKLHEQKMPVPLIKNHRDPSTFGISQGL